MLLAHIQNMIAIEVIDILISFVVEIISNVYVFQNIKLYDLNIHNCYLSIKPH